MAATHSIVCAMCGDNRSLIQMDDIWRCINRLMCDQRRQARDANRARKRARNMTRRARQNEVAAS